MQDSRLGAFRYVSFPLGGRFPPAIASPHFSPGSRPALLSRRLIRKEWAEKRSTAYG